MAPDSSAESWKVFFKPAMPLIALHASSGERPENP
jgi:hypothetical protein